MSVCLGGAVLVHADSWSASIGFMGAALMVVVRQIEVLFGLRFPGLK